jgi:hypothetical protein
MWGISLSTRRPIRIRVSREIRAAPQSTWALLTDTYRWPQWGPSVRHVACKDRFIRRGSEGIITTAIGLRLPFEITEYTHGRWWTWNVAGFKATGHRLIPVAAQTCTVAFEMPLPWLPYAVICRWALINMAQILAP